MIQPYRKILTAILLLQIATVCLILTWPVWTITSFSIGPTGQLWGHSYLYHYENSCKCSSCSSSSGSWSSLLLTKIRRQHGSACPMSRVLMNAANKPMSSSQNSASHVVVSKNRQQKQRKAKPPTPARAMLSLMNTKSPEQVEMEMSRALESLRSTSNAYSSASTTRISTTASAASSDADGIIDGDDDGTSRTATASSSLAPPPPPRTIHLWLFPTIRECNTALKSLGDNGDMLRALRLLGKMRSAVVLSRQLDHLQQIQLQTTSTKPSSSSLSSIMNHKMLLPPVPAPTLVTYSTLMSRAIKLSKPRVALRLWDLMMIKPVVGVVHPGGSSSSTTTTSTSTTTTTTTSNSMKQDRIMTSQQATTSNKVIKRGNNNNNNNNRSSPTTSSSSNCIQLDVKAVNIRMNCFAKLANVQKAMDLLQQMKTGQGPDILVPLVPNLVTYNTLLDACYRAYDLDAALVVLEDLKKHSREKPDARTYTTILASLGRKPSQSAGRYDPSMAFTLLEEMQTMKVRPNGMTYTALIDACGRCRRSDLALKGLRMMLQQKAQEQQQLHHQQQKQQQQHSPSSDQQQYKTTASSSSSTTGKSYPSTTNNTNSTWWHVLPNEVGAWTAAINACGKAGHLETAMKLFYTMPTFGVLPNTITCGCIMNVLLRQGGGGGTTKNVLDVLQYMKENKITPSEVMYTSLMTHAERMLQIEKNQDSTGNIPTHHIMTLKNNVKDNYQNKEFVPRSHMKKRMTVDKEDPAKAINVYTALMKSLMDGATSNRDRNNQNGGQGITSTSKQIDSPSSLESDSNTLLLRVFLVFQEMKVAGAEPDLACYNALLKACARAGDLDRAKDVLRKIAETSDLDPNDTTWRLLMEAATATMNPPSRNSDLAMSIWKQGIAYVKRRRIDETLPQQWIPSASSFATLLSVHLREASSTTSTVVTTKTGIAGGTVVAPTTTQSAAPTDLYACVVHLYDKLLLGDEQLGFDRMNLDEVLSSQRVMLLVLQGIVGLHDGCHHDPSKQVELRKMATSILQLECFTDGDSFHSQLSRKAGWASQQAYQRAQSWLMNPCVDPSHDKVG